MNKFNNIWLQRLLYLLLLALATAGPLYAQKSGVASSSSSCPNFNQVPNRVTRVEINKSYEAYNSKFETQNYGTNEVGKCNIELPIWNADKPIDLTSAMKAYGIHPQTGQEVLINPTNLAYHVMDRQTDNYRFNVARMPTEYYFNGGMRDEWGKVVVIPEVKCVPPTLNIGPISTGATKQYVCSPKSFVIEVLDIGIYFTRWNAQTGEMEHLRWNEFLHNKTDHVDGYDNIKLRNEQWFNPNKKTLVHSHGWSIDHTAKHDDSYGLDRMITELGREVNVLKEGGWFEEYNIIMVNWFQHADHPSRLIDALENLGANYAGVKIYTDNQPKSWPLEGVPGEAQQYTTLRATDGPVAHEIGWAVHTLLDETGWDSQQELRLTGHSLGALMVTTLTDFLLTEGGLGGNTFFLPNRLSLLDAAPVNSWWSFFYDNIYRWGNSLAWPAQDWYQSSNYDALFRVGGLVNTFTGAYAKYANMGTFEVLSKHLGCDWLSQI